MVWYEDMKKDLISVIRGMSKFLGYHLTELKVNSFCIFLNSSKEKCIKTVVIKYENYLNKYNLKLSFS
jgi:hypothetical protein